MLKRKRHELGFQSLSITVIRAASVHSRRNQEVFRLIQIFVKVFGERTHLDTTIQALPRLEGVLDGLDMLLVND